MLRNMYQSQEKLTCFQGELDDLDAVDLSIILDAGKLDRDLTRAICGSRELLHIRFVGRACARNDVEVAQHLLVVDADVEDALTSARPVGFGKVQTHRVRLAGGQTGDGVAEGAVAITLADGQGRGIAHAAGIDLSNRIRSRK